MAHTLTLNVTKALAGVGVRVLWDNAYLEEVSRLLLLFFVLSLGGAGDAAGMGPSCSLKNLQYTDGFLCAQVKAGFSAAQRADAGKV